MGKKPSSLVISDHVGCNLGFSENKRWRKRPRLLGCDEIFDVGVNISDVFIV
jgi:hypothetical protein